MILLLSLAAGCYQLDAFFFAPEPTDAYALGGDIVPADCQELVTFPGKAGDLYGAWAHQPLDGADTCTQGERNPDAGVLLYFHGNTANIDHYWENVGFYWESGFEVLVFDYRGYGASHGETTHDGVLADGAAAVRYLGDELGLGPESLLYVGLSLGGYVAVHTAVEHAPRVLITEDTFASAQALIDQGTLLDIPQGWLFVDEFDTMAAARRLPATVPYLVVHGAADTYIQPENARLLHAAAASEVKELFLVPGMDHNETVTKAPEVYRPWLECWSRQDCADG